MLILYLLLSLTNLCFAQIRIQSSLQDLSAETVSNTSPSTRQTTWTVPMKKRDPIAANSNTFLAYKSLSVTSSLADLELSFVSATKTSASIKLTVDSGCSVKEIDHYLLVSYDCKF